MHAHCQQSQQERLTRLLQCAPLLQSGIQQGIGHTLYEDYQIDLKTGRSLNANFVDYKMPLSMDMPPIRTGSRSRLPTNGVCMRGFWWLRMEVPRACARPPITRG